MHCKSIQLTEIEISNGKSDSLYKKSTSHTTLKMQSLCTLRYEKVIFNIHNRTLFYHGMPILLEAKIVKPRNLYTIYSHKIKNFTVNRKERCCSR